jgi:starvation-inducible outer membrane lipoprotein
MTRCKRLAASLLIAASCVGLAACSRVPKNARGQTPIRYVRCDAKGQNCTVAARFETVRSCERWLQLDATGQPNTSAYCMP